MKHLLSYSLIGIIIFFTASCSVYEELYFKEDGQVNYQLTFDSKELMKSLPGDSATDMTVKDSILSIADIIHANSHVKKTLYPQEKEDLNNISAFVIKKHEDPVKKEYTFTIQGEFADTEALNKALYSLNRLIGYAQDDADSSLSMGKSKLMDQLSNIPQYKWDGISMERYTVASEKIKPEEDNEEDEIGKIMGVTNPFTSFLMGGKMMTKYHFPTKVDIIDNPEAMLSQDGKTVIVNYQATIFAESPEEANINITTIKK